MVVMQAVFGAQVLYVPSAQRLIEGGTFQKGEDGLWETPEVARDLLRSMLASHKEQLADCTITSGKTLLQVGLLAQSLTACVHHNQLTF